MVVMLALVAGITAIPAYAASNGIYTATATPHYRNPITGKIEDSGGEDSEVLGQSMTESATDTRALVEVDSNGNTYITVRLKLMDNIQNPTFKVDGSSVSASLMQEDYSANTADYRMKVASENSVIRCSMYVVPMGRNVIFFITVSNLKSGSGGFGTQTTQTLQITTTATIIRATTITRPTSLPKAQITTLLQKVPIKRATKNPTRKSQRKLPLPQP